jgi:Peptidase A4 family
MKPIARRLTPLVAVAALAGAFAALPATAAGASPTAARAAALVHQVRVAPDHLRTRGGHTGKTANDQSENWSGYIKTGSGLTSSTASWTVPTLSTADEGYSSTWVGIDGASSGDQYLIQTGTEADVVNGHASYDAWWEVITPTDEAPETLFTGLNVNPGDSITATVAKGSGGTWTMTLKDNNSGATGTHSSAFAGPGQSAEWIQEDTDVNGYISAAPDWGSVAFSGITVNGANPQLGSAEAVDIVDSQGTQEDSTGSPNGTGDGFGVTWLATGTPTYVGG